MGKQFYRQRSALYDMNEKEKDTMASAHFSIDYSIKTVQTLHYMFLWAFFITTKESQQMCMVVNFRH